MAAALGLAVATLVRYGITANGVAWALVQFVLIGLAAYDLASRRIPNALTMPGALIAVGARAAFERSALVEVCVAGAAAFAVFLAIAIAFRGGLGMGDVKLAGLLGFLLGSTVTPALLIGTAAGGVVAAVLVARGRRGEAIAYGPYLALGGAVAVLALGPPPLV